LGRDYAWVGTTNIAMVKTIAGQSLASHRSSPTAKSLWVGTRFRAGFQNLSSLFVNFDGTTATTLDLHGVNAV
jgi:hypothetical protein